MRKWKGRLNSNKLIPSYEVGVNAPIKTLFWYLDPESHVVPQGQGHRGQTLPWACPDGEP